MRLKMDLWGWPSVATPAGNHKGHEQLGRPDD